MKNETVVGDVFQINERMRPERRGWVGAFVLTTEVFAWGIQGFVSVIATHETQGRAYIRLEWDVIDFIGHAHLVPEEVKESMDNAAHRKLYDPSVST